MKSELNHAFQAYKKLATGRARGKIVIRVAGAE